MKPWYRSRTIWWNLALLPALVEPVVANIGLIQKVIPENVYPWIVFVFSIGNVWLRVLTTEALKERERVREKRAARKRAASAEGEAKP